MRKRLLVAAGAAAVLAAGGAVAFAEPDNPATAAPPRDGNSVQLPTGDMVTVSPSGGLTWHPGDGRADIGYVTPQALDGSKDIVTIPLDRVDDIAEGKEDPRRYNVSQLLRAGESDAAKADRLSDKKYGRFVPVGDEPRDTAADKQKVTFTVTDRDGKAPASAIVTYVNPETGDYGEVNVDENGTGTVSLPPGPYDFHSMVDHDNEIIFGLTSVTVEGSPVEATADGTKAKAVKYEVDRPSKLHEQTLRPFTVKKDGDSFGNSASFPSIYTGYVIPNEDSDHKIGVEAVPHLVGTDDADPYIYDLNFFQDDGIPADPTFTAADKDLARVKVNFDGYATEEPAAACNNPLRDGGAVIVMCTSLPVDWHKDRTEYLTPGSDISWQANLAVGEVTDEFEFVDIEGHYIYDKPGPAERVTANAPLSFNVAGEHEEPVVARDGDKLHVALPFLDNTNPDETFIDFHPIKGTAVLKRDGEEIGRNDMTSELTSFTLPDNDSGTYTLSADVTHPDAYTPLATKTSVEWRFESKPTDKATPLDVSAVGFDAEGIAGGYADASEPQKFTLDYHAQEGATDTSLADLTFEVSYDDGKTWDEVDVKVDGDSATGKLKHPDGAKFVSVRATATDDAGNKTTHSTIHAYGLK